MKNNRLFYEGLKKVGVIGLAAALAGSFGLGGSYVAFAEDAAESGTESVSESASTNTADTYADAENAVTITLSQDGSTVSGSGASVSGNVITISAGGSYWITGSLTDGQIYVEADGDDTVVLMLAGVEITNTSDAAIYVDNADLAVIYLVDGTENQIVSGEDTGSPASDGEVDDTAEGGAIWAKDDLLIGGSGARTVTGFINNGIQTSNDLTIESGTITVDAVNNGIKGKDSATITGGTITVTSGGDGIKSDDDTGEGYGVITIEGGEIQIESGEDGMQAETVLTISGGTITVTAGGGSAEAGTTMTSAMGGGGFASFFSGWDMEDEDTESMKGLKAGTDMQITGGTISVDSYDDSLHSNGTITILSGDITVASGDDGVHAETELMISDGTIVVTQSYEGLEANQILIEGGEIEVTASDDGINANGGTSSWGMGMMMGSSGSSSTTGEQPLLLITGGTLWVSAQGDGLDSNGDLTIEGGTIIVDGPSDSMNGALDYGSENGGVCTISGGTILAVGSSGMAENFESSSTQYSFMLTLSSNYSAESIITISDADGNVLFEHTAARAFSSVIFSSPDLEEGGTYQITVDSDSTEITLSSVAGNYSWSGELSGTRGGGPVGGQMGGGRMDDNSGGRMGSSDDSSQMGDLPDGSQLPDAGDGETMPDNSGDSAAGRPGGNSADSNEEQDDAEEESQTSVETDAGRKSNSSQSWNENMI
ncbi:MAG: carbohydrate-binding domain-containing protein [Lachnospiraceae bacterium]|nr:carbohydrate-binding domain-containing protein [Lachnospiraceae bacterium]